MEEIWKNIEDWATYEISNLGRVRTIATGLIKKPFVHKKGYLRVQLEISGYKRNLRVHRLVAMAFIPNPDNKPAINHKNFNKGDNNVINLEWVTDEENRKHYTDEVIKCKITKN